MTDIPLSCPKCDGEMVLGMISNRFDLAVPTLPSEWTEGRLTDSLVWGIQLPKGKASIPVGTFRCQACGYLESYARKEFAAKLE